MDTPELFQSAYSAYWALVAEQRVALPGQFLPYDYSSQCGDLIYSLQEQEFTRELLNAINQLSSRLNQLLLWEEVIPKYEDEWQLELRMEFTALPIYYCLHQPYEFRSRLIFAATQLCYTRGIDCKLLTKADVCDQDHINYASLDRVAKHWAAGSVLMDAIRNLNGREFREQTRNYRNRSQHAVPPGVDYGHTNVIERTFPPAARVAYSFGEAAPLATVELIPQLKNELQLMINAFAAYRKLIDDHAKTTAT